MDFFPTFSDSGLTWSNREAKLEKLVRPFEETVFDRRQIRFRTFATTDSQAADAGAATFTVRAIMISTTALQHLIERLGKENVYSEKEDLLLYGYDSTPGVHHLPEVAVFPTTTEIGRAHV